MGNGRLLENWRQKITSWFPINRRQNRLAVLQIGEPEAVPERNLRNCSFTNVGCRCLMVLPVPGLLAEITRIGAQEGRAGGEEEEVQP